MLCLPVPVICHTCKACQNKFSLYAIGAVKDNYEELLENGVIIPGGKYGLDRISFDSYVKELDYILYFYGIEKYKLIASGAIFELKNTYFEYLSNKYGDIGFLCDNIEQMATIIENLSTTISMKFNFSNYYVNLNQASFIKHFRKLIFDSYI